MKNTNITATAKKIAAVVGVLLLQGCLEDFRTLEQPDFQVSTTKTTVKKGEVVSFNIRNAPNLLTFYSGEIGKDYKYRKRTKVEGEIKVSFKTSQKWGLLVNRINTLSFWYSKDYDGSGTKEAVQKANWTKLNATFSELYDFNRFIPSGDINITDLSKDGKPVVMGFKFKSNGTGRANRSPEWRMDDFNISIAVKGETYSLDIANMNNAGFRGIHVEGTEKPAWNENWYTESSYSYYRFRPTNNTINDDEGWLVTKAIDLTSILPDKGIGIKSYASKLENYKHVYTKAGTYTATFMGRNTTIDGTKEQVQTIKITVTD